MLHQYLMTEVINYRAAREVLTFLNHRTLRLIRDAIHTLEGTWIPLDKVQPVLKSGEKVYKIEENSEGIIIVYMCLSNETCSTTRPLYSDKWCSEDLVTILEAMHTD